MSQEEYNKVYDVIKDINWNNADDKTSESLFEEILENAQEVNGAKGLILSSLYFKTVNENLQFLYH